MTSNTLKPVLPRYLAYSAFLAGYAQEKEAGSEESNRAVGLTILDEHLINLPSRNAGTASAFGPAVVMGMIMTAQALEEGSRSIYDKSPLPPAESLKDTDLALQIDRVEFLHPVPTDVSLVYVAEYTANERVSVSAFLQDKPDLKLVEASFGIRSLLDPSSAAKIFEMLSIMDVMGAVDAARTDGPVVTSSMGPCVFRGLSGYKHSIDPRDIENPRADALFESMMSFVLPPARGKKAPGFPEAYKVTEELPMGSDRSFGRLVRCGPHASAHLYYKPPRGLGYDPGPQDAPRPPEM